MPPCVPNLYHALCYVCKKKVNPKDGCAVRVKISGIGTRIKVRHKECEEVKNVPPTK